MKRKILIGTLAGVCAICSVFAAACTKPDDAVYYTVSFETNGGSAVSDQRVKEGECATEPETSKDGFEFQGWYSDEAFSNAFDFATPIVSNQTLYASWADNALYEIYNHFVLYVAQNTTKGLNYPTSSYDNFVKGVLGTNGASLQATEEGDLTVLDESGETVQTVVMPKAYTVAIVDGDNQPLTNIQARDPNGNISDGVWLEVFSKESNGVTNKIAEWETDSETGIATFWLLDRQFEGLELCVRPASGNPDGYSNQTAPSVFENKKATYTFTVSSDIYDCWTESMSYSHTLSMDTAKYDANYNVNPNYVAGGETYVDKGETSYSYHLNNNAVKYVWFYTRDDNSGLFTDSNHAAYEYFLEQITQAATGIYRLTVSADDGATATLAYYEGNTAFIPRDPETGTPNVLVASTGSAPAGTDETEAAKYSGKQSVEIEIDSETISMRLLMLSASKACNVTVTVEYVGEAHAWTRTTTRVQAADSAEKASDLSKEDYTVAAVPLNGSVVPVLGDDGFYHMNSATGAVIYVNLTKVDSERIGDLAINQAHTAVPEGGSAQRGEDAYSYTDYDDVNYSISVYNYADAIADYSKLVNADGYYPLDRVLYNFLSFFAANNCIGASNASANEYKILTPCIYYCPLEGLVPSGDGSESNPYKVITGVNSVTLDGSGKAYLNFTKDGSMHKMNVDGATASGDVAIANGACYVGGSTVYTDGQFDTEKNTVTIILTGTANAVCKVEIAGTINSIIGLDEETATAIVFGTNVYSAHYLEGELYATHNASMTVSWKLHVSDASVTVTLKKATGVDVAVSENGVLSFTLNKDEPYYFVFEAAEPNTDFLVWFE